jgi:hypothetical protein
MWDRRKRRKETEHNSVRIFLETHRRILIKFYRVGKIFNKQICIKYVWKLGNMKMLCFLDLTEKIHELKMSVGTVVDGRVQ